jgi:predicted NUDIX family NTP pyrophosphohydrolase
VPKRSAGALLYRHRDDALEVLVVHPGGPFFAKKDLGAWSIPKGLYEDGEDPLATARREFEEETGTPAPDGPWLDLGEVKLKSGKVIRAFAAAGDLDADAIESNTFELEWPRGSGDKRTFPEVDRAAWLSPDEAKHKLNPAQGPLVDRLIDQLQSTQ